MVQHQYKVPSLNFEQLTRLSTVESKGFFYSKRPVNELKAGLRSVDTTAAADGGRDGGDDESGGSARVSFDETLKDEQKKQKQPKETPPQQQQQQQLISLGHCGLSANLRDLIPRRRTPMSCLLACLPARRLITMSTRTSTTTATPAQWEVFQI